MLKLGLIGGSDGNGHPWSWSAICNGYEPEPMASCPYPVIPEYLAQQEWPTAQLPDVQVTHLWMPPAESSVPHLSHACRIPYEVEHVTDMLGHVDAVLLARDDAERHYEFAEPFLKAGVPIYIDKPLALSIKEARRLYETQKKPGQIFTCSALAYAPEMHLSAADALQLGELVYVDAITPKSWEKYAIHVIEPLLNAMGHQGRIGYTFPSGVDCRTLDLCWVNGLRGRITALGTEQGHMELRLYGTHGFRKLRFTNTFRAFRNALEHFCRIVRKEEPSQRPEQVLPIIELVEAGCHEHVLSMNDSSPYGYC